MLCIYSICVFFCIFPIPAAAVHQRCVLVWFKKREKAIARFFCSFIVEIRKIFFEHEHLPLPSAYNREECLYFFSRYKPAQMDLFSYIILKVKYLYTFLFFYND